MKAEKSPEQAIPKEAGKEGKKHIEKKEKEVKRTEGKREDQESPMPDANQHRSGDVISKPQNDKRDTM